MILSQSAFVLANLFLKNLNVWVWRLAGNIARVADLIRIVRLWTLRGVWTGWSRTSPIDRRRSRILGPESRTVIERLSNLKLPLSILLLLRKYREIRITEDEPPISIWRSRETSFYNLYIYLNICWSRALHKCNGNYDSTRGPLSDCLHQRTYVKAFIIAFF